MGGLLHRTVLAGAVTALVIRMDEGLDVSPSIAMKTASTIASPV